MDAALTTILKTTPPADVNKTLKGLKSLVDAGGQETLEAFMRKNPLPFQVYDKDLEDQEKPFLCTRMNRITGNIYRSPWTYKLYPPDVKTPELSADEKQVRLMESRANEIWDAYRVLYYGPEAIGSVYLQQMKSKKKSAAATDGSIKGIFGIQKNVGGSSWNSIHVVHVEDPKLTNVNGTPELKCNYHVESTVLVVILPATAENTETDISANITKSTSRSLKVNKGMLEMNHLENLGTIIEDVEIDLRSNLELVHIPRTKQLIDMIQSDDTSITVRKPTKPNAVMQLMKDSEAWQKKHAEVLAQEAKE